MSFEYLNFLQPCQRNCKNFYSSIKHTWTPRSQKNKKNCIYRKDVGSKHFRVDKVSCVTKYVQWTLNNRNKNQISAFIAYATKMSIFAGFLNMSTGLGRVLPTLLVYECWTVEYWPHWAHVFLHSIDNCCIGYEDGCEINGNFGWINNKTTLNTPLMSLQDWCDCDRTGGIMGQHNVTARTLF